MKQEMETVTTENGSLLQFYMERKIPEKVSKTAVIKNQLRKKCSCSIKTTKKAIVDFFPVLQWLPKYNCKEYIWGDVMSGLIIGIILVPQAIAYSLLAGLKPIYSLYTSFFANIIYFLMGTSRHVSVGIFSLLSLMVGQVVDRELLLAGFNLNDDPQQDVADQAHLNFTVYNFTLGLTNNECGKECYAIEVATALTFMAGVYQTLLNEMIDEESHLKEKIEKDIEIQKNQLNVLRYQLGLDPYKVDDGLTILQLEKEYRLALDSALKEKQERLEKLTQLQREDQALCTELCVAPYYIPTGSIPNSTELEEIKEHVTNLLKVKEQRLEEFHKLRREIRLYSKEIGHTPDGTLENNMLCDDEEEGYICLTKKYLEDLQQLIHQLQKKKESLMATKDVLMKQVQLLWDRLQWPQEKQEQFTEMTSQCSISEATNMWEEELQTLEEVKKEKVKEIILKVRQDLESYWQKCFYSDEQKAEFQPFYDDNFSEELLKHHDEEVFKIKMIYEEAKYLYDSVHKWEAILDHFIELEKKSTDPSRLLNRGGNLLKDERERSKTQKQLSKLGEELKKKIENWEQEHNSEFLIRSQRFLDSMAHQLTHYKLKKDQPKTSVKREESATPKGAMKRTAHLNTPTTNKIRKVASNLNVLKASSCNNIATNFAVPSKQSFQSKTPSKSTPLYSLHQPSLEECKKSKSASQPSYSDFLKELAVKSSINNRILNSTLKENLDE